MLPPIKLTPQHEELCRRLDVLTQRTIQGQNLSDMFQGAIYATREENRSNPDWMAQSAHSLREILYLFKDKNTKGKKYQGNWIDAFRYFGSATIEDEKFKEVVGEVYNKISGVAHHRLDLNIEKYEKLISKYEKVLLWSLDRQVDVHHQIDKILFEDKPEKSGR